MCDCKHKDRCIKLDLIQTVFEEVMLSGIFLLMALGLLGLIAFLEFTEIGAKSAENHGTRCTAGSFQFGEPASVTCYFYTNIKESSLDFYVTLTLTMIGTAKTVILCNWFPNKTVNCVIKEGFVLRNNEANTQLTLDIPQFEESHAGLYKCFVINLSEEFVHGCNLTHKDSTTSGHQNEEGDSSPHLYWIISVPVIIVAGVIAALYNTRCRSILCSERLRFYRHERRLLTNNESPTSDLSSVPLCSAPSVTRIIYVQATQTLEVANKETTTNESEFVEAETERTQTYTDEDYKYKSFNDYHPLSRPLAELRTYPMDFSVRERIRRKSFEPVDVGVQVPDFSTAQSESNYARPTRRPETYSKKKI